MVSCASTVESSRNPAAVKNDPLYDYAYEKVFAWEDSSYNREQMALGFAKDFRGMPVEKVKIIYNYAHDEAFKDLAHAGIRYRSSLQLLEYFRAIPLGALFEYKGQYKYAYGSGLQGKSVGSLIDSSLDWAKRQLELRLYPHRAQAPINWYMGECPAEIELFRVALKRDFENFKSANPPNKAFADISLTILEEFNKKCLPVVSEAPKAAPAKAKAHAAAPKKKKTKN